MELERYGTSIVCTYIANVIVNDFLDTKIELGLKFIWYMCMFSSENMNTAVAGHWLFKFSQGAGPQVQWVEAWAYRLLISLESWYL